MTVDPSLAELSDRLFSIAVALYSVAVVAFSAQLAFGRRPARELVPTGSGGRTRVRLPPRSEATAGGSPGWRSPSSAPPRTPAC